MASTAITKELVRQITLRGIADMMFDRYAGDNKTQLPPWEKFYKDQKGGLVLPALNISSLLSAQNTSSAPKRFLDAKQYKKVAQALLSYISINPFLIPITRGGKQIRPLNPVDDEDVEAGLYIHRCVARLDKGIPNPKIRPVIRAPWEISFSITILPNDEFNEEMLRGLIERAGVAIGLGTYRGVFGKFVVEQWK